MSWYDDVEREARHTVEPEPDWDPEPHRPTDEEIAHDRRMAAMRRSQQHSSPAMPVAPTTPDRTTDQEAERPENHEGDQHPPKDVDREAASAEGEKQDDEND